MKMETAPFKTILVGDNGTSTAEHAVSVALFLARELNSRVIVLGVVTPPSAESQAEGYGMDDPAKARALLQEKFSVLKRTADEEGISLETHIVDGDPEKNIETFADRESVDLIVVGHRDVNRVRRWLEGSTSEDLVKKAKTSVLVVRNDTDI
ncbi:MAG: universal stress protein [Acidobacteriaceae bacterium]